MIKKNRIQLHNCHFLEGKIIWIFEDILTKNLKISGLRTTWSYNNEVTVTRVLGILTVSTQNIQTDVGV